LNLSKNLFK